MDGQRGEKGPAMDKRVWSIFHNGSRQVQFLLDHNRLLINEINQNHEAKIPEGLTRNVMLIRELNNNIGKVVDLYATMSTNFSHVFDNLQEVNSDQVYLTSKHAANGGRGMPADPQSVQAHKKMRPSEYA